MTVKLCQKLLPGLHLEKVVLFRTEMELEGEQPSIQSRLSLFWGKLGNCATFAEVNLSAPSLLYGIEHFHPVLRKTFCAEVGGGDLPSRYHCAEAEIYGSYYHQI